MQHVALTAHLVRLDLLEAVRPELLIRFLRPFEDYLTSRGVALDGVACATEWIATLHAVLNAVDPEIPGELQQGLLDVADLTTESAHEHVLSIAKSQQLGLFTVNARTTPEDLAFEVYLDHRDVFRSAHARVQSTEARRFVEFFAKDASPLAGQDSVAKRALLARAIGGWFRDRNRTAFCDVRVSEAGDEVSFVIIHGRPPRNHGAIESDDRRSRVTYVPDKHDILVFDRRTGRLAVNAQFFGEQDFYRRVRPWGFWGPVLKKVLADDPAFQRNPDFLRDMFNVTVGIVWQVALVALPIYNVIRHSNAWIAFAVVLVTSAILKFTWYDHLRTIEIQMSANENRPVKV